MKHLALCLFHALESNDSTVLFKVPPADQEELLPIDLPSDQPFYQGVHVCSILFLRYSSLPVKSLHYK